MIKHLDLPNNELRRKIKQREIVFGGNMRLKIYGTLHCKSNEARTQGFRPCGHCMRKSVY
jgi:hypothetical protein